MRFFIELCCHKNEFPTDMRRVVLSIIKNTLTNTADGKFFNQYYTNKDPIPKDFCFSVVLGPNTKFLKDKVELSSNTLKVYFSTSDKNRTGLILMNSFLLNRNKRFPLEHDNYCTISNVNQINQELIYGSNAVFRTFQGSPIVVRNHDRLTNKDKYYSIADEDFEDVFLAVIKLQAQRAGFKEDDVNKITLKVHDNCKKIVVKNYGIRIDTTAGFFTINATPDILQYFYEVGLGSKNSQGFGMLNLVSQSQ